MYSLVHGTCINGGCDVLKQAITSSGERITTIDITDYSISEVLRVFIRCRNGGADDAMSGWLTSQPYQALSPLRKSAVLAFMCNELLSGKYIQNEIERNIDKSNTLRKDKWEVDNELRRCASRRRWRVTVEALTLLRVSCSLVVLTTYHTCNLFSGSCISLASLFHQLWCVIVAMTFLSVDSLKLVQGRRLKRSLPDCSNDTSSRADDSRAEGKKAGGEGESEGEEADDFKHVMIDGQLSTLSDDELSKKIDKTAKVSH